VDAIEFSVDGLPPIKRGSQSMWGKQIERIKPLRAAAAGQPHTPATLEKSVHLRIVVFAEVRDGDLDGFVAGICDGLQPAPANVVAYLRDEDWVELPEAARPDRALGFTDDRAISRIDAERRTPDGPRRYEVCVEWS
jgi:hypothetical protein